MMALAGRHDESPESAALRGEPADARTVPPTLATGARGREALLEVQRSAGNRAVGRLLRSRRPRTEVAPRAEPGRRVLARRRMPGGLEVEDILSDNGPGGRTAATDAAASQAGLDRLWTLVKEQLTGPDQGDVAAVAVTGLTTAQLTALPPAEMVAKWSTGFANWNAMKPWEQQKAFIDALGTVRPDLKLGDPRLIDIGPRPATADAANIQTLVDNANKVFDDIAAGKRDTDIKQVFGDGFVDIAKAKYREARKWMNKLHTDDHIVTDRSGYNEEVSLGGLTGFHVQISLQSDVIDHPGNHESIVTMIHESLHAGNSDVKDKGYINQPSFDKLPTAVKLTNAAHFEVVPRRMLPTDPVPDPAHPGQMVPGPADPFAFAGQTFTPAGSTGPSGHTPPLTPRQKAIRAASEMFREAWTLGLNLHTFYVQVYKSPSDWDTMDLASLGLPAGTHLADVLPFWSKVEKLTIHERTHINAAAGKLSTNPVTLIDVALSEGVTRKLGLAMDKVPQTEADADAFEQANATAAEITAATATVDGERDLLMKLVISKKVNSIGGGSLDRELRATIQMGTAGDQWKDILKKRPPSAFPD